MPTIPEQENYLKELDNKIKELSLERQTKYSELIQNKLDLALPLTINSVVNSDYRIFENRYGNELLEKFMQQFKRVTVERYWFDYDRMIVTINFNSYSSVSYEIQEKEVLDFLNEMPYFNFLKLTGHEIDEKFKNVKVFCVNTANFLNYENFNTSEVYLLVNEDNEANLVMNYDSSSKFKSLKTGELKEVLHYLYCR